MCGRSRRLALSVGVISLIQSAISVGFGVVGLLMYSCVLVPPPPEDPASIIPTIPNPAVTPIPDLPTADDIISFITTNLLSYTTAPIYYQYFHSQENCQTENVSYWRDVSDFSHATVATSSAVNGFFIGYVIENALWLLSALLLFVGAVCNSRCLYRSYSSTLIGVMMYDIVLIVIFALDFGISHDFASETILETITKETMLINTALMVAIFSRLVIFFIINIFLFVIMSIAIKDAKPKAKQMGYAAY